MDAHGLFIVRICGAPRPEGRRVRAGCALEAATIFLDHAAVEAGSVALDVFDCAQGLEIRLVIETGAAETAPAATSERR